MKTIKKTAEEVKLENQKIIESEIKYYQTALDFMKNLETKKHYVDDRNKIIVVQDNTSGTGKLRILDSYKHLGLICSDKISNIGGWKVYEEAILLYYVSYGGWYSYHNDTNVSWTIEKDCPNLFEVFNRNNAKLNASIKKLIASDLGKNNGDMLPEWVQTYSLLQ